MGKRQNVETCERSIETDVKSQILCVGCKFKQASDLQRTHTRTPSSSHWLILWDPPSQRGQLSSVTKLDALVHNPPPCRSPAHPPPALIVAQAKFRQTDNVCFSEFGLSNNKKGEKGEKKRGSNAAEFSTMVQFHVRACLFQKGGCESRGFERLPGSHYQKLLRVNWRGQIASNSVGVKIISIPLFTVC